MLTFIVSIVFLPVRGLDPSRQTNIFTTTKKLSETFDQIKSAFKDNMDTLLMNTHDFPYFFL